MTRKEVTYIDEEVTDGIEALDENSLLCLLTNEPKSLFRNLCRWQKQADFLSVFAFLKAHSRCYATEKR